jgi:hypothetical protein
MTKPDYDFTDAALAGHFTTIRLMAKLVDKGIISAADAIEVLDDVLLQLEEYQAPFPEYQQSFESARDAVSRSLDGYRSMLKQQPG